MSVLSVNTMYSIEINSKKEKKTRISKEDFFRKVQSEMLEAKESFRNKKNFLFTLGKLTSSKRRLSQNGKHKESKGKLSTNEKNQQETVFKKLNLEGIDLNLEGNSSILTGKPMSPMKSYSQFTSLVLKEIKYPSLKRSNFNLLDKETFTNQNSSSVILLFFSVGIMIVLILAVYNNKTILNSLQLQSNLIPSIHISNTSLITYASLTTITLLLILQIVSFKNRRNFSRLAKEDYNKLVIIAKEYLQKHEKHTFYLLLTEFIKKFALKHGMNVEDYSKNVFSLIEKGSFLKKGEEKFFYLQKIEGKEYIRLV